MSRDYTATAERAQRMIERAGGMVVLRRVERGDYDPETGGAPSWPVDYGAVGVKVNYDERFIDGTQIRAGDQRLYMGAVGIPKPQAGDQVVVGTSVYEVVRVAAEEPADVPVVYILQIRGIACPSPST